MNKIKLMLLTLCAFFINFQIGSAWATKVHLKNGLLFFGKPATVDYVRQIDEGGVTWEYGSIASESSRDEDILPGRTVKFYFIDPIFGEICHFDHVKDGDTLSVKGELMLPHTICFHNGKPAPRSKLSPQLLEQLKQYHHQNNKQKK
jgi:hypothetical protein